MTDMQGNQHYEEASKIATPIADSQMFDRQFYVYEANLHATLALAFEQRTANLIAAFAQLGEGDVSTYLGDAIGAVEDMGGKKLAQQIAERLGFK